MLIKSISDDTDDANDKDVLLGRVWGDLIYVVGYVSVKAVAT